MERKLFYHLEEVLRNEKMVLASDLEHHAITAKFDFMIAVEADPRDEDSRGALEKYRKTTMAKAIEKGVKKWHKNGGGYTHFLDPSRIHLSVVCKSGRQIVVPRPYWDHLAKEIIKKFD
jgi:hypothetical protein